MKDIILEIENFSPIEKAKINLGKINIMAGENATGKTTISKILYSLMASISREGAKMYQEKIISIVNKFLNETFRFNNEFEGFEENHKELFFLIRDNINDYESLRQKISEIKDILDENGANSNKVNSLIDEIFNYLEINKNVLLKKNKIIELFLCNEFGNEKKIFKEWNEGFFKLYSNESEFKIEVNFPFKKNNNSINNSGSYLINDLFYIDTPYIVDFIKISPFVSFKHESFISFHQKSLFRQIHLGLKNREDTFFNQTLLDLFNDICMGGIYYDDENYSLKYEDNENEYLLRNTSTGMKSIGVLKSLIMNNLDRDSLIIMDEPEVHLHPEWQVKLAELIVRLSAEGDINFYINSHSPYFIESIEVYSKKYGVSEDTNFYLAEEYENTKKFNFREVKRENLKEIYRNLGKPYDVIDMIRGENLADEL